MIQKFESKVTFNPILVWFYLWLRQGLQVNSRQLSIPFWSDFILTSSLYEKLGRKAHFQSHFGLILSNTKTTAVSVFRPFNPILVWFYQVVRFESFCYVFWAFNPILVWFYPQNTGRVFLLWLLRLSIPFWSDFIKPTYTLSLYLHDHFQSHFGLILSPSILFI